MTDRTTIDRIRSSTHVDAPIAAVWKAITTPAESKRWFFGVDQVVAWDLAERDGGTELTITEENLPSDAAARTSEAAWAQALTSLKGLLER